MNGTRLRRIEEKCDLILIGIAEIKAMLLSQPKKFTLAIEVLESEARLMQRLAERELHQRRRR